MKIRGTEGLTPADIQAEIARGGRFVAYQWCISVFVMTFKRVTSIQFLRAGQSGFGHNFGWSLFTLLAGWWGFPWGPIYTIGSIWTNLRGGIDVTEAIANDLAAQGAERVIPLVGSEIPRPKWGTGTLVALAIFAGTITALVMSAQA